MANECHESWARGYLRTRDGSDRAVIDGMSANDQLGSSLQLVLICRKGQCCLPCFATLQNLQQIPHCRRRYIAAHCGVNVAGLALLNGDLEMQSACFAQISSC